MKYWIRFSFFDPTDETTDASLEAQARLGEFLPVGCSIIRDAGAQVDIETDDLGIADQLRAFAEFIAILTAWQVTTCWDDPMGDHMGRNE